MKINVKAIYILLIVALMLSVAGCTAPKEPAATQPPAAEPKSDTPTLDKIRAKGTLILGTESTYPPFEFIIIKDGKSVGVGMDVSLGEKIAEKIGVKFETSEMAFDAIIPAITVGTVDIGGSMTPTEERKQVIDFSDLYYFSSNNFIVRKGEEANFSKKEDFAGKTIGAQQGTIQNTMVVEEFKDSKNLILPKVSSLIQELKNGNIDAIMVEAPVADTYVKAHQDLASAAFTIPDESGGVAISMAKGTDDLRALINEVIKEMMANGEMDKIYQENVELAIDQIVTD